MQDSGIIEDAQSGFRMQVWSTSVTAWSFRSCRWEVITSLTHSSCILRIRVFLVSMLDDESQEDLRANKNLVFIRGALYENMVGEALSSSKDISCSITKREFHTGSRFLHSFNRILDSC